MQSFGINFDRICLRINVCKLTDKLRIENIPAHHSTRQKSRATLLQIKIYCHTYQKVSTDRVMVPSLTSTNKQLKTINLK